MGVVYAAINAAMPGLVKIGYTERNLPARMLQLSRATGVPSPFHCYCAARTKHAAKLEKALHEFFQEFRYTQNREFFRLHPERVRESFTLFGVNEMRPEEYRASLNATDIEYELFLSWIRNRRIRYAKPQEPESFLVLDSLLKDFSVWLLGIHNPESTETERERLLSLLKIRFPKVKSTRVVLAEPQSAWSATSSIQDNPLLNTELLNLTGNAIQLFQYTEEYGYSLILMETKTENPLSGALAVPVKEISSWPRQSTEKACACSAGHHEESSDQIPPPDSGRNQAASA